MKLKPFLKATGTPVRTFAERAGVSIPTVYAWLSGRNIPNREMMARIVEATDGAVTANDFHGLPRPTNSTLPENASAVERT